MSERPKNYSNLTNSEKNYYLNVEKIKRFKEKVMKMNKNGEEDTKLQSNNSIQNNNNKIKTFISSKSKKRNYTKGKFKLTPLEKMTNTYKKDSLLIKEENNKIENIFKKEEKKQKLPPINSGCYQRILNYNNNTFINCINNNKEKYIYLDCHNNSLSPKLIRNIDYNHRVNSLNKECKNNTETSNDINKFSRMNTKHNNKNNNLSIKLNKSFEVNTNTKIELLNSININIKTNKSNNEISLKNSINSYKNKLFNPISNSSNKKGNNSNNINIINNTIKNNKNPNLIINNIQINAHNKNSSSPINHIKIGNFPNVNPSSSSVNNPKEREKEPMLFSYIAYPGNNPKLINEVMRKRSSVWKKGDKKKSKYSSFIWTATVQEIDYVITSDLKQMTNHFEFNCEIANKMKLFANLIRACDISKKKINLFSFVPLTIIFPLNNNMSEYFNNQMSSFKYFYNNISSFVLDNEGNTKENKSYNDLFYSIIYSKKIGENQEIKLPKTCYDNKNYWLIKPINMNRGRFIKIENDFDKIVEEIQKLKKIKAIKNSKNKTVIEAEYIILQKYIERPLLYKQRKFDIRIWVLLISECPNEVYIFKEGHLKATCDNYSLNTNDKYVHLTNYSVQKKHSNFSKTEKGNEISYKMLQDELNEQGLNINFRETIYKKICKIIRFTAGVAKNKINILKREKCFEIFGYDFLIDADLNPFLIEINTNPGLEISSPLIKQLVPRMIDDCFKLTIDKEYDFNSNDNANNEDNKIYHVEGYDDNENMWEKFNIINV